MKERYRPNVIYVEGHILGGVRLLIEDITYVVKRGILKRTILGWGSDAVGILKGQSWLEDSCFEGEIVEPQLQSIKYSLVLVSEEDLPMFQELKQGLLL